MEDSAFVNKNPLLFLFSAGMKHKNFVSEGYISLNIQFAQNRGSQASFTSLSLEEDLVQTPDFIVYFFKELRRLLVGTGIFSSRSKHNL